MSELHEAAATGNLPQLQSAYKRGADLNQADDYNSKKTPLHLAASGGHVDCIRYLLRQGADATLRMKGGWTPAHSAAETGSAEALAVIVDSCPAANTTDNYGDTPQKIAELYGHTACVELLKKRPPATSS